MASTSPLEASRDVQEWTARLQAVGGKLRLASRTDAGRGAAPRLDECVEELRQVWAVLRQMGLRCDPARIEVLQQRGREVGVVLDVLGGAAGRLGAASEATSARVTEELGELDQLADLTDARLANDCLRAVRGRVRGATRHLRKEATGTRPDLDRSALLLRNCHRELALSQDQAPWDPLTQVASRHAFTARLEELAAHPSLITGYWCVALVEIDTLETVNRRLGRCVGDALLFRVAGLLQDACEFHPGALVARTSGKEFGLLLPRCPLRTGRRLAEHVQATVRKARWACKLDESGDLLSTSVSVGLVEHAEDESADDLLARAEAALDQARQAGPNALVADG
ncbi:MAG: GGDEF domain-containing protein [Planctomycetota bacterium]